MRMRLQAKVIGMFVEDGFEDLEFWVTVMRLREEGAEVPILGADRAKTYVGKNGLKAKCTRLISEAKAELLDGLVVPGGWAPDKLRRDPKVLELVRGVHARGNIVGLICHAGLVGISAKIVKGLEATGSLGIKDDLENAGCTWVDKPAFRSGNVVWGRVVEDIPDFCRELVNAIAAAK
jgi:protease I